MRGRSAAKRGLTVAERLRRSPSCGRMPFARRRRSLSPFALETRFLSWSASRKPARYVASGPVRAAGSIPRLRISSPKRFSKSRMREVVGVNIPRPCSTGPLKSGFTRMRSMFEGGEGFGGLGHGGGSLPSACRDLIRFRPWKYARNFLNQRDPPVTLGCAIVFG